MIKRVNNLKDSFQCKSIYLVLFNLNVGVVKENKKVNHWDLVEKYSDLLKVLRITSYILRFINKLLIKSKTNLKLVDRTELKLLNSKWFHVIYQLRCFRTPSVSEMIRARFVWTYIVQLICIYMNKSHVDRYTIVIGW